MSERPKDPFAVPPGFPGHRPSSGDPELDRQAYARAVREAGYGPIGGSGEPPPDTPAAPGYAPPLGGVPYPLPSHAGYVPSIDSLAAGAPVSPDYLRRAPAGRIVLLVTIGVLLLAQIGVVGIYVVRFGSEASLRQMIRLAAYAGFSGWLYGGSERAYWMSIVGLTLGALAGVMGGIAILEFGAVAVAVIALGVLYGVAAAVLAFVPSVREFLESQRLRQYPGSGGSL
ncbi:MAG TPA: hypothetical protein VGE07_10885 [Herpetosiphonaceae bacterium]